jgi:hypothetical protein
MNTYREVTCNDQIVLLFVKLAHTEKILFTFTFTVL